MELRDIIKRTDIPERLLRYVLDQGLVPKPQVGLRGDATGTPRFFTEDAGLKIACAALLLRSGLKQAAVKRLFVGLESIRAKTNDRTSDDIWEEVTQGGCPALLDVANGRWIKLALGSPVSWDSGWIDLATGKRATSKATIGRSILLQVDMAGIRDQLQGKDYS